MINVVAGDTIIFEAVLKDNAGTAVTNAAASITTVDAIGSTVMSGLAASHTGDGTYQRAQSTTGWGTGPITEYWKFTNTTGTLTNIVGNKFRIQGTSTLQPYVWPHELFSYYENVEDYFDGSELERVYDSFNFINQQLINLNYNLPVVKGNDGYYDQALRDWNALDSVYRIVSPRAMSQVNENEGTPWFDRFKRLANEKWEQFRTKKVVLNSQTSPGEAGIQPGTKVGGTLYSTMETNWQGYGNGFQGEDFPRTWRIEVLGTGTSGSIGEGTFRWSMDNGMNWEGTGCTTTSWQHLRDEVYIRFTRGTATGTTGLFTTADVWQFNTSPLKYSTGGKNTVKSY